VASGQTGLATCNAAGKSGGISGGDIGMVGEGGEVMTTKNDKVRELVEVLAQNVPGPLLVNLCKQWGVERAFYLQDSFRNEYGLDSQRTIRRLARHALNSVED
jgi:hypothetical protein